MIKLFVVSFNATENEVEKNGSFSYLIPSRKKKKISRFVLCDIFAAENFQKPMPWKIQFSIICRY